MGLRGEREEGSLIRSLEQMSMTIGCQKRDFLHPMDGDLAAVALIVAWKVSEREKGVSIPPLMVVVVLIVGIKEGRWEWDYEW